MADLPSSQVNPGDDLAPAFDLIIEGKGASKSDPLYEAVGPLIASVAYEEDEEMAGLFELTITNQPDVKLGTGSPADWKAVLDCKAFQEGNAIDLFMGYGGNREYMGRVEIVKWLPKGGAQGTGTFLVKGYDGRHRMMEGNQYKAKKPKEERDASRKAGRKTQVKRRRGGKKGKGKKGKAQKQRNVYRDMRDDQIVEKVAAKYGFAADCDVPDKDKVGSGTGGGKPLISGGGKNITPGAKPRRGPSGYPARIQTTDQSDWQFLRRLADINRFDLWVDYDLADRQWVVHFKRRADVGKPELTFAYNGLDGSLLEWEGDFSVKEKPTSIEVLHFDRKNRSLELTSIEDEGRAEDVRLTSAAPGSLTAKKTLAVGARVHFMAFGQTLEAVANRPFRSRSEAEAFVKDWLKERDRDLVILKGKVVGVETLRPRQIHEFIGMSTRLDGYYRLTQVRHEMDQGKPYIVEFVAHKVLSEEVTRRKPQTKSKTRVSGKQVISGGGKIISNG